MNLRNELKQLPVTSRDLRKFGLVVGGVFLALGLYFFLRKKGYAIYFAAPGLLLMVFGALLPRSLKWIYLGWMTLALVLGTIVSTILLTLFFFLVITPVGLLARAFGNDFLSLRLQPNAASYWRKRQINEPPRKSDYEQQY